MEDKDDLDPRKSLQLIRSMIETSRNAIIDTSHYYLLWGWAVMLGCLVQYGLLKAGYPRHYQAWFVTLVATAIHLLLVRRDRHRAQVYTYVTEANNYLWIGIGSSFFIMTFIFVKIGWQYSYPFYILFYAVGTFVSGSLIKFKPLVWGGVACAVIAPVAAYVPFDLKILLLAFSILISYIIPGHLLRHQYSKNR